MTEREFVYWLQGFLEVANPETITAEQVKTIKDHMKLVLTKVTPSYTLETTMPSENGLICAPTPRYDIHDPQSIYHFPRGAGILSC